MSREVVSFGGRLRDRKTVLSFLVSFVLLYFIFSQVDLGEVFAAAREMDPFFYLAAAVVSLATYPVRGFRWQKLLENINVRGRLVEVIEIFLVAWAANSLVPAKLGDVYRGYLIKRGYRVSISRVMGTIYVERLYDIVLLVLLLVVSSSLSFKMVPREIAISLEFGLGLVVLLFLVVVVLFKKREGFLPSRLQGIYWEFREGIIGSVALASVPFLVFLSLLVWVFESLRLLLVIVGLGLHLPVSMVVFVALGAALLTAIPFTPGGLGAVEGAMVVVLMLAGFSKGEALAVALLDRVLTYWLVICLGVGTYLLKRY